MTKFSFRLVLGAAIFSCAAYAGSAYQSGDVFAAVGNGLVDEFTPTGTLVQVINDGSGSAFTTGMAFDSGGNLFVTNFSNGTVSKLDNSGNIINSSFITGLTNPESLAISNAGNIFVGDAGTNKINEYNSSAGLLNSFTVATQSRGTDWIDLAPDQKTILYTSEGTSVLSYDTSTSSQNPNFANGLPGSNAYALREIGSGAFTGDVLVADSSNALLIGTSGNILQTYNLPGNGGGDFSLNLDPSGNAFWTGDFSTGQIWEVNIANGSIMSQFNTGSSALFGIAVFGESGQPGTPEPGTLVLLGGGLVALAASRKFVRRGRN